jgi:cell division septation protein DedD
MIKNKILILAIGILSFGDMAGAKTLQSDNGPAELPPASFKGKQYVDSKGCVYIKAGFGTRVTWVPRVNRSRKVFCNTRNKPSLNSTQLAAISGKPATRLIKPAAKTTPAKTKVVAVSKPKPVLVAQPTPKPTQKTAKLFGSTFKKKKPVKKALPAKFVRVAPKPKPVQTVAVAKPKYVKPAKVKGIRLGPQAIHPSDIIRAERPAIQGGTSYNIASSKYTGTSSTTVEGGTAYNIANTTYTDAATTIQGGTAYNIAAVRPERTARAKRSVRGFNLFSRRQNRLAIRTTPQEIHPADVIRGREIGATYQQATVTGSAHALARGVDDVHNLTIYPTTIAADVTPRGDAQMELVWSNTVPRKLIKRVRAKQVASTASYTTSTKSQTQKVRKSTKVSSTASKTAKPSARFVQIGTFGNSTNAKNTISRFQARGLPVSSRTLKKNGKNLRVIFLGPFKSANQLRSAMNTARSSGFSDAFYVR